jgi:hypothetical protein
MMALIIFLAYTPGVNTVFRLSLISTTHACTGLWMLPVIIMYDEFRKYMIRRDLKGIWSKLTLF